MLSVDFILTKFSRRLATLLYLISFVCSFYVWLTWSSCTKTFFLGSWITSAIAFAVPVGVYFKFGIKGIYGVDSFEYALGKALHVIAAVVATVYNALALASAVHYEDICKPSEHIDWIIGGSIVSTICYNGVTFLGHIMMKSKKEDEKKSEEIQPLMEERDQAMPLPLRKDLQKHRYRF